MSVANLLVPQCPLNINANTLTTGEVNTDSLISVVSSTSGVVNMCGSILVNSIFVASSGQTVTYNLPESLPIIESPALIPRNLEEGNQFKFYLGTVGTGASVALANSPSGSCVVNWSIGVLSNSSGFTNLRPCIGSFKTVSGAVLNQSGSIVVY